MGQKEMLLLERPERGAAGQEAAAEEGQPQPGRQRGLELLLERRLVLRQHGWGRPGGQRGGRKREAQAAGAARHPPGALFRRVRCEIEKTKIRECSQSGV